MAKPFSTVLTIAIGLSIGGLLMLGIAETGIGNDTGMLAQLQTDPVSPLDPSTPEPDTASPFDQDEPSDVDPLLVEDEPVVPQTVEKKEVPIVDVVNSMGQSLYNVFRDDAVNPRDDGSFIYSPIAATYQLGVISAGGDDTTRSEIAATLGTDAPAAEIGQALQTIAPVIHPVEYRLGVSVSSSETYGGALRIEAVKKGSTAAALRLIPGDYIVAVNGHLVSSTAEFNEQVSLTGGKVALHVFKTRPGMTHVYNVEVFPDDPARLSGASFYAPGYPLSDSFRTEMDENFLADMIETDFARTDETKETIRKWVRLGAGGKLPHVDSPNNPLVKPEMTNSLVSMASLFGRWENPIWTCPQLLGFETLRGNLQTVSACYTEGVINCALGDRVTMVELPLSNSPLSVVLIKPANLSALHDIEQLIVAEGFGELKKKMRKKPIRVRMPLLNLSTLIDYKGIYKAIGIKNAFAGDTSMSPMFADGTGKIGLALQESRMNIWDGGKRCTGDGLVAPGLARGPMVNIDPKPERMITINRYFIIYIYDRSTDATWFVGRCAKIDEGHSWGVEEAIEREEAPVVKSTEPADDTPEAPADTPTEDPIEVPEDTTVETPADTTTEDPAETPAEDTTETPAEVPADDPEETPADDTTETPEEVPAEDTTETPVEAPAEEPVETPVEIPAEDPIPTPVEDPIPAPVEDPIPTPVEDPIEEPVEAPADAPAEDPFAEPAEAPAEAPAEEPAENPVVPPAFDPGETSAEVTN